MLSRKDLIAKPVSLIHGDIPAKRAEIKAYFNQTYQTYEALFNTLTSDQAFYERPCALRHPLIFYFGHTATFFTNKLVLAKLLPQRINPSVESLCAIGVDEMSWDDLNETHYDWPSVEEIRHYRAEVAQAVNQLIDTLEFNLPIDWQSPMWPIMMGIEHERIHLETSSVLIRQLPLAFVKSSRLFPICPISNKAPENYLLPIPEGIVNLDHQDPAAHYGWDNEYGRHHAQVAQFQAATYLVSNQEFLSFVEANGYETAAYWSDEGNRWRLFTPNKHPTFWRKNDQTWTLRCMTEEIDMPWDWPVEVNYLEAEAFCRWKTQETGRPIRLPSEDEYLRLADVTQAQQQLAKANVNLQLFASSTPVNYCATGDFFDVIGNVWQWTQTPIYPFEGFKVHPLYDDFTTPTFDNQHNIFKGGSWISSGNETNGHSRYAFRRHFFQHAGFRYVESDSIVNTPFLPYETDHSITESCEFHYGENDLGIANFPHSYAQLAIKSVQDDPIFAHKPDLKVLEVGCNVGRGAFELAKVFDEVTALDFSARFIQIANQLKQTDIVRYTFPKEGDILDFKECPLSQLDLKSTAQRCQFLQQDACNLKPIFRGYDMIVAANLIDRLYEPKAFLETLHNRLNPGGLLLLASAYDWSEKFTEKHHWIGGYKDLSSGENITTLDGLTAILSPHFTLQGKPVDLAYVRRETQRTYQHNVTQVTLWKKKND